ncbi:MAG TPA: hypothetical protein VE131_08275 [Terriglobales bacterium]|nr:hypothetical protein [Terriglobales bacterium]
MAGLFGLLIILPFAALTFILYRDERKNKRTRIPLKPLLLGHDFSKGSPWKSSSMTKETSESPSEAIGESPEQELLEKIFRPRTDEGIEKKEIGTILTKGTWDNPLRVVGEHHDQGGVEKIDRPLTDEGTEKKDFGTIVIEDEAPTEGDVGKMVVEAKIVEDNNPTDEDAERGVGRKITYMEFQKLLLLADRLSSNSAPRKSDYGRGYHMAIQIHFNNPHRGSLPDHYSIVEIARRNRCRNVHAFARGYRDGFMGLKPEYTDC